MKCHNHRDTIGSAKIISKPKWLQNYKTRTFRTMLSRVQTFFTRTFWTVSHPDLLDLDVSHPYRDMEPDISNPDDVWPDIFDRDVSPPDVLGLDVSPLTYWTRTFRPDILDQDVSPPGILDQDVSPPDFFGPGASPPDMLD